MAIRDVRDLIAVLGQRGPGKRTPPLQGSGGASNVGCGGRLPTLFALGLRNRIVRHWCFQVREATLIELQAKC